MSRSARTIALLTNPTAGTGSAVRRAEVAGRRLRDAGFTVRSLSGRDADETLDLAREVVAEGLETLVVCGGDGTVHHATQALVGSSTRLGIVPAGAHDDVARSLGLPLDDPAAAADRIVSGRTRTVDLARSGDRHFLGALVGAERATYTLDLDGDVRRVEASRVEVGNGPSCDGYLDVLVVPATARRQLLRVRVRLHVRARKVTLAAAGVVVHADGERLGALPLTVEVVPAALVVHA